jgi:hypothetical protein
VSRPWPSSSARESPNTAIWVAGLFGDSLAELLGQGLDTVYDSSPDVAVIRRAKGDSGLGLVAVAQGLAVVGAHHHHGVGDLRVGLEIVLRRLRSTIPRPTSR